MKSIRSKILISIVAQVTVALMVVGALACILTYQSTQNTLKMTMNELVIIAANNIDNSLTGYKNLVSELANNAELTNTSRLLKNKQGTMDAVTKRTDFNKITVVNVEGLDYYKNDWNESAEFNMCRNTMEPYISDPYLDESGVFLMNISAPVVANGNFFGIIVCEQNADFLSKMVGEIKVGEGGTAQIFRENGDIIAHTNYELAKNLTNYEEYSKRDPSYAGIAGVMENIMTGNVGFETYAENDSTSLIAYAPIPHTSGWRIAVTAPQRNFISYTLFSIIITLAVSVISIIIAVILAAKLAGAISKPITLCAQSMDELAKGNLSMETIHTKSKDETAVLVNALNITVENFKTIISDVSDNLGEMAKGNMAIEINGNYNGDFAPIKTSMEKIVYSLNQTLSKIQIASDQVSNGANQVSNGAQALSQGATEQASAIEGLSSTILDISQKVRNTAHNATQANENVAAATVEISNSDEMMREMLCAMSDISLKSGQISKIIKTIDDIAFQTNILALNAAVEAARAGQAGKGFAVVADEVRNLASKSADAAKNTTKLIEGTLAAVKNGTKIANNTASSLSEGVSAIHTIERIVQEIAQATDEEATSIVQITQSVDQISAVVQTNSATAEESAAASEELSGQAQMLKDLTETFTLKDMDYWASDDDSGDDDVTGADGIEEIPTDFNDFAGEFTEDDDDKYAVSAEDESFGEDIPEEEESLIPDFEEVENDEEDSEIDEIELFDLDDLSDLSDLEILDGNSEETHTEN